VSEISAVIFDIGNVLVRWDPRNLYRQHFENTEEMEKFLRKITTPEWNLEQDRGRSFQEAVTLLSHAYPQHENMIKMFDINWLDMLAGEISGTVDILNQLVEDGVPVFAITNFSAEKWPAFCDRHPFSRLFQGVVVSGEEKLVKPDPAIFNLALNRFGLLARNCIFIDDVQENIVAAQALGITGHHFTDASALAVSLKSHGFLL